ncbi:MAG: acyl-[acyl-carrier-protein] thioesterase [Spirochaetota bacterium]
MSEGVSSGSAERHLERFLVRSYEVEPDGRLRIVELLRMLQEAAWQHASLLGKGFTRREEGELFWVLSRLRLTMERYPRWGDRFTIRTFPVGTQRLFALREFVLLDEADSITGRASSAWLVVDGGRGRPIRPERVVADIVTSPSEYGGDLEREPPLPGAADPPTRAVGPSPVRYHDIDQYRHVNNAAYLEWVLDALDPERPLSGEVCELALDFLKETLLDDAYTVWLAGDATTDRFEVVQASSGEPAARGHLAWRPLA